MAKEQRFFGTNRGLGLHASRRGLLQAGLAIGTLALGQRAVLGQSGGAHVHMPELGVAKLPVVPAMDQPLVEPEVRRSVNGVLCDGSHKTVGLAPLEFSVPRDQAGLAMRLQIELQQAVLPTARTKNI